MKHLILVISLLYTLAIVGNADLVIFSYNRPLQLYALLESITNYVTGLDKIMVIYRSSDARY